MINISIFGFTPIREFDEEDYNIGYYFQVFLKRPENKVPVSLKMWETEREALEDLPYIIPSLIQVDPKEPDSFIIKDSSILSKMIFVAKIEKPQRMTDSYTRVEDVEKDYIGNYLNRNNIMFKVKVKTSLNSASRNRAINIALINMRGYLKATEFTKKCVKYTFKENNNSYERFINTYSDSLLFAYYDAYIGIPNPKTNIKSLEKFYSELRTAINNTNKELMPLGYKLEMTGEWDRGYIVLASISSVYENCQVIYEEPTNLKIDGQPADDGEDDDDAANYKIEDEPEEETEEDAPAEEEGGEEPAEEPEEGGEEPEEGGDDAPADYRLPDTDEGGEGEPAEEEGGEETEGEPTETEGDDAPADYRLPDTDEGGDDAPAEEGEETEDAPEGEETTDDEGGDDAPADYRLADDAGEEGSDEGGEEETTDDGEENTEGEEVSDEEGDETEDPKAKENELLSDLTPEQRRIQDEELKDNYIKLHNSIGEIIIRLNKVPMDSNTAGPLNFVISQLNDMKEYVYKYLSEVYSTKTYIENSINYQQYLVILANINTLLSQLTAKSSDIE